MQLAGKETFAAIKRKEDLLAFSIVPVFPSVSHAATHGVLLYYAVAQLWPHRAVTLSSGACIYQASLPDEVI